MSELMDLSLKYGTDKALFFIPMYEELIGARRFEVKKVLEFGIGGDDMIENIARIGGKSYTRGASVRMWQEYFPNAEIFALDFKPELLINEGRIKSFLLDQSDESAYARVIEEIGSEFDFIVEDGSHIPEHQILAMTKLMPLLKDDGVYVMEDVIEPLMKDAPYTSPDGNDWTMASFLAQIPYRYKLERFHRDDLLTRMSNYTRRLPGGNGAVVIRKDML